MLKLSPKAAEQLQADAYAEAKRRFDAQALHQQAKFEVRGAALAVRHSHDREVLLCGPAGTGKTRGILEYLDDLCWQYPGVRFLIARKTRASMTESVLYTFEEFVVPPGSPVLDGAQRLNRHSYHYPNSSEIVVGGLDKPARLFSTEWDIVYIAEAIEATLTDWESLFRSLRHNVLPWQQLIGDTNPGPPTHWLKQRCDAGTTKLIPSKHEDNPLLYDGQRWTPAGLDYLSKLDAMSGPRKARLRHGLWAQAEGAVYEDFDAAVHVIDRFDIPSTWRRFRVIDFGFTNPFVCQWWAVDPDGRLIMYREIYHTQRIVDRHARQIIELSADEKFEATITDHDAEDNATLQAAGISTKLAVKDVSPGIQAVQARLKPAGDDTPRLFLMRDALVERDPDLVERAMPTCTQDELPGYIWTPGADGKPLKEEPVKVNDHGCDSLRYMVMHLDGPKKKVWFG